MKQTSRREFLSFLSKSVAMGALGSAPVLAADGPKTAITPDQALALMRKGNVDFLADKYDAKLSDRVRRLEIAKGQKPFCVLVGCSDSRVSPEILFGRGLGELFIVRVAGNTVDNTALGSIEYAVAELGVPLILVLGHEKCGAVQAAVDIVTKNAVYPGAISDMVEPIVPAVLKARTQSGDLLDNSVRENVKRVVSRLKSSQALLAAPIKSGKLKVVGARYDLVDDHTRGIG